MTDTIAALLDLIEAADTGGPVIHLAVTPTLRAALAAEADRGTPLPRCRAIWNGCTCARAPHDDDRHVWMNTLDGGRAVDPAMYPAAEADRATPLTTTAEHAAYVWVDEHGVSTGGNVPTSAEADRVTPDRESCRYCRTSWAACGDRGFPVCCNRCDHRTGVWLDLDSPEAAERLAAVEHDQWMTWARSILSADDVTIGPERLARWQSYMVPYGDLPESVKEHDRVWARAALAALREQGR